MDKNSLIECHNRIKPYIHNTPVITSTQINKMTGADIYFKCDNFQKMGAFKMRGATNAILQLPEDKKSTENNSEENKDLNTLSYEELLQKVSDSEDEVLRSRAELENFKKRTSNEITNTLKLMINNTLI